MGIEIVKEICVGASKHGRWGRCEAFPVISAPAVSLIALPGYTLTTWLAHHTGGVLYTNTNTNTNTITNTNINMVLFPGLLHKTTSVQSLHYILSSSAQSV